ncbi:Zwei Ig domain protein zig-8 [Frankliniella fusca]|uniref:Zwei Ig domain protein zig-8 n=1 Tax=Frankliniella fusca TaxID=407009 RepID=A0AAE1GYX0_9NEOP|nr:Zwei Ig domain protein zig-8 [Frankliniella fusca]
MGGGDGGERRGTAYVLTHFVQLPRALGSRTGWAPNNNRFVRQVSWVRHRDTHLLTVGVYTYTNDQRFRAQHGTGDDWVLQLKYPQHRDAGTYECQVSTTPHMSHLVNLTVVEPSSEILGGPDLYIDRGSTINLTCIVLNSPEPPAYVIWNHNDAIISYDSPRGGVSVVTEKGVTTESFLLIQSARPSDSGRYTCNPSNAQAKGINVHVLNGEHPAAMQHAGQAHRQSSHFYCLVFCLNAGSISCILVLRYGVDYKETMSPNQRNHLGNLRHF